MSPVPCKQRKVARIGGPSDWLSFLVPFWTSKNERKNKFKTLQLTIFDLTLKIKNLPA